MGPHALKEVVEVADLAWETYEHFHKSQNPSQKNDQLSQLQSDLFHEREENIKLRAALNEVQHIILENFQGNSDISQQNGDIVENLIKAVTCLDATQLDQNEDKDLFTTELEGKMIDEHTLDDSHPWLCITSNDDLYKKEEKCFLEKDSFVIVYEEDVIEGIALLMSEIIACNPKAKSLTPEQLQSAITKVFEHKGNKMKNIWNVAKLFYILFSWGITLYGLYTTRHIVKGAVKLAIKSGRVVGKAF